jgi:hypothetical protein
MIETPLGPLAAPATALRTRQCAEHGDPSPLMHIDAVPLRRCETCSNLIRATRDAIERGLMRAARSMVSAGLLATAARRLICPYCDRNPAGVAFLVKADGLYYD